jgi:phosphoenolpyruvate---glycerone phosphotransferase subunit DhaL
VSASIDYDTFVNMLRSAAARIQEQKELLSQLDSHGGDGDHGPTMARAMTCMLKAVDDTPPGNLKALCNAIAWAIMGADGGSTGPLYGSLFMGMAGAAGDSDSADLAALFSAGLTGVEKRTKARPGDKTMMDALTPAVAALQEAVEAGHSAGGALLKAAAAAEAGAAATTDMQARFGRAKNLGEKSLGEPDPGATSTALFFRGCSEGVQNNA